jgi:Predicted dehydrogenases and related proteins
MSAVRDQQPEVTSSTTRLRVGVVGLGMAGGTMVSAIKTHPAIELAGGVDPHPELRRRFTAGEGIPAFRDLEGLLADETIDAVYIATPHQLHRDQSIAALDAGKHVVVEKPMALSLDDCDAMIAAADRAARVLIVGHTHGFDPALAQMRRIVDSGRLGRLAMIATFNYTDYLYRPRRPEELDTARGGGILFNQLPHQVEMLRTLTSAPPRSVRALTRVLDPARPTEGACMALLEFQDGTAATIIYSGHDGFDTDEWHGWTSEGGFAKAPGHGRARRRLSGLDADAERDLRRNAFGYGSALSTGFPQAQPHFGVLIATCEHGDLRQAPEGVRIYSAQGEEHIGLPETPWRPGRGDVLEELRAAVIEGVPPVHDGRFGRATMAVCLAIQQSAREQREIVFASPSTGRD